MYTGAASNGTFAAALNTATQSTRPDTAATRFEEEAPGYGRQRERAPCGSYVLRMQSQRSGRGHIKADPARRMA